MEELFKAVKAMAALMGMGTIKNTLFHVDLRSIPGVDIRAKIMHTVINCVSNWQNSADWNDTDDIPGYHELLPTCTELR